MGTYEFFLQALAQYVSRSSTTLLLLQIKKTENCQDAYLEYDLPFGWKKIGIRRGKSVDTTKHVWDFYLISPTRFRFGTNEEVNKWLKAHPDVKYDPEVTNTLALYP